MSATEGSGPGSGPNEGTGSQAAHEHVNEQLSGYLDGELTQQDAQRVSVHLEGCAECRELAAHLREVSSRVGAASLNELPAAQWGEKFGDPVVKRAMSLGWLAFIGGCVLLGLLLLIEFVSDGHSSMWTKLGVAGVVLGLAGLFVAVLRQRLLERKRDKYKDVEI